jgi:hypothetical protein
LMGANPLLRPFQGVGHEISTFWAFLGRGRVPKRRQKNYGLLPTSSPYCAVASFKIFISLFVVWYHICRFKRGRDVREIYEYVPGEVRKI